MAEQYPTTSRKTWDAGLKKYTKHDGGKDSVQGEAGEILPKEDLVTSPLESGSSSRGRKGSMREGDTNSYERMPSPGDVRRGIDHIAGEGDRGAPQISAYTDLGRSGRGDYLRRGQVGLGNEYNGTVKGGSEMSSAPDFGQPALRPVAKGQETRSMGPTGDKQGQGVGTGDLQGLGGRGTPRGTDSKGAGKGRKSD